jgi:CRISPR-associated endoribonuclease Cas6
MRLRILLQPSKPVTIPLNYGHQLSSAIYSLIADADAEYASFLHEVGYSSAGPVTQPVTPMVLGQAGVALQLEWELGSLPIAPVDGMPRRFKLFAFSQLRATKSRVQGSNLVLLPGPVEWIISSPVEKFVREFASGLLVKGSLRIGPHEIPVGSIETMPVPEFGPTMRFKCLSPIVASVTEDVNGKRWARYLRPKDPAFSERVRQNLLGKHLALHGQPPTDDSLTLEFDSDYLTKNRGTKLVQFKEINIVGAWCPFTLSGSPELIRLGYDCGLGEKNAAGFGMVEIKS